MLRFGYEEINFIIAERALTDNLMNFDITTRYNEKGHYEIFIVQPGELLQYLQERGNEFLLSQNGVKYPIDENIICFPDK